MALAKLIRNQEELDLDWYDNDLRRAFDDVTESWFKEPGKGTGCDRTEFEREVLDYGDVAPMLEERLWEAERSLAEGTPFSPFVPTTPAEGTDQHPNVSP
ncbi:hypothetical protein D3C73_1416750 [compost metagenome]